MNDSHSSNSSISSWSTVNGGDLGSPGGGTCSNRYRGTPFAGFGIDTIAIVGPARPELMQALEWKTSRPDADQETGEITERLVRSNSGI